MTPRDTPTLVRRTVVAAIGAVVLTAASTLLGPYRLDWSDFSNPQSPLWSFRVPRTMLAALVGAGLAVGGMVFQQLFRNPLATPYTLGIASGASLAASIGYLCALSGFWYGLPRMSLTALVGALAAMGLVYLTARVRRVELPRLLLAGVTIAYLSSAGVLLVTYLAGRSVANDIVVWMMGSLAVHHAHARWEVLAALLLTIAYVVRVHRELDLLAFGDFIAATRGVDVERTVWTCFLLVGFLTAVIVANCGPIGFVGLMVPHLARPWFGERSLPLLAGSLCLGAPFLALCDGIARSVSVAELPVGVVTQILGAIFFFYLLLTRAGALAGAR